MFRDLVYLLEFSGKDALDDVNKYIAKGWVLVNTHSAGTEEAMDFYYILGTDFSPFLLVDGLYD